jgi:O-antigen/teichoic acid export membrane protein
LVRLSHQEGTALPRLPLPERSALVDALGGKAAELTTQVLLVVAIPRILGPADYGTFALALAVVTLGSTSLALGGPTLMSRYVPAAPSQQRAAVARALAVRAGRWRAGALAAVVAAAALLAALVPADLSAGLTALVVAALALDVAATLAFQVALGFARTRVWSYRFAFQNSLLIVAVVLGHEAAGIDGAVAGIAVGSGGVLLLGIAAVGRRLYEAPATASVPAGAMRFGAMQGLGNLFVQLTHRGGIVAVAVLAGSRVETGFAALALGVVLAITYAVWQVFGVLLPILTERWSGDEERSKAESALRRVARWSLAMTFITAVLGVLLVDDVVPRIFGSGFAGAEPALALALASLPLTPMTGLATQAFALHLRSGARAITTAAGATVFLLTAAVAVPAWHAAGASAALVAAAAVTAVASRAALPGSVGGGLLAASLGGSAAVTALALLTTSL